MGSQLLRQETNGSTTEFLLEPKKGIEVKVTSKRSTTEKFFRFSDLAERSQRVRSDKPSLSRVFGFGILGLLFLIGGLANALELRTENADREEAIFGVVGCMALSLFFILSPTIQYFKERRAYGELYVFLQRVDGSFAFSIEVGSPSEREASEFRNALEEAITESLETTEITPLANDPEPQIADEIQQLAQLRTEGVLSDEEFAKAKAILISH